MCYVLSECVLTAYFYLLHIVNPQFAWKWLLNIRMYVLESLYCSLVQFQVTPALD